MLLTLYHDNKESHNVFNVIKVTVDNHRTLTVTVKERRLFEHYSFRHEIDYQRLTIQVD